jgi:hypothetical protein
MCMGGPLCGHNGEFPDYRSNNKRDIFSQQWFMRFCFFLSLSLVFDVVELSVSLCLSFISLSRRPP